MKKYMWHNILMYLVELVQNIRKNKPLRYGVTETAM